MARISAGSIQVYETGYNDKGIGLRGLGDTPADYLTPEQKQAMADAAAQTSNPGFFTTVGNWLSTLFGSGSSTTATPGAHSTVQAPTATDYTPYLIAASVAAVAVVAIVVVKTRRTSGAVDGIKRGKRGRKWV